MRRARRGGALLTLALLAGCGGGGTVSDPAGSVYGVPALPPGVVAVPSRDGTTAAVFTLGVPGGTAAKARAAQYVSANTASVKIALVTVNGSAPSIPQTLVQNLTPGSPSCGGSPPACTVTFASLSPGSDTFSVTLYDRSGATGHALATGTATATLAVAQTTTIPVTLNGIVGSVALALPPGAPCTGSASTVPVTLVAYDPSGAAIGGAAPYASPVVLSDSDTSGTTAFAVDGATGNVVHGPSDVVTLAYDGAALGGATLGSSVAQTTAASFAPQACAIAIRNVYRVSSCGPSCTFALSPVPQAGDVLVALAKCADQEGCSASFTGLSYLDSWQGSDAESIYNNWCTEGGNDVGMTIQYEAVGSPAPTALTLNGYDSFGDGSMSDAAIVFDVANVDPAAPVAAHALGIDDCYGNQTYATASTSATPSRPGSGILAAELDDVPQDQVFFTTWPSALALQSYASGLRYAGFGIDAGTGTVTFAATDETRWFGAAGVELVVLNPKVQP